MQRTGTRRAGSGGDLTVHLDHTQVTPRTSDRVARASGYRNLEVVVVTDGYDVQVAGRIVPGGFLGRRTAGRSFRAASADRDRLRSRAALAFQLDSAVAPPSRRAFPPVNPSPHLRLSHANYGFVFRAAADDLLALFRDPETNTGDDRHLPGVPARRGDAFLPAHRDLWDRGLLVGSGHHHNFDCQCADLGLRRSRLRRYDWRAILSQIEHDERARSLLMIGVHADRRLVQMRARRRGLKVLFIDPETYGDRRPGDQISGRGAPVRDLFVRATAHDAFTELTPRSA